MMLILVGLNSGICQCSYVLMLLLLYKIGNTCNTIFFISLVTEDIFMYFVLNKLCYILEKEIVLII